MDAVIINLSTNELLVVEAKRFSNPALKMKEVSKDIERIHSLVAELKTEDRIEMDKIKKCYLYPDKAHMAIVHPCPHPKHTSSPFY